MSAGLANKRETRYETEMEIKKKKMLTHACTSSRASRDTFGFFLLLRETQPNPPETPKLQEEPQKNLNQLKLKVPDWRLTPVPHEDW